MLGSLAKTHNGTGETVPLPSLTPEQRAAALDKAAAARRERAEIKNRIRQIDIAATRLIDKEYRLNYQAILKAAKLSPHADKSTSIRNALMRWVNNFTPRD